MLRNVANELEFYLKQKKKVVYLFLPSNSFSQFFNPRMASIVCLGVIVPNLREVSPRQISSEI